MNHTADFPYVQKRAVLEALGHHPFRPPWWLRGRHGQTAFAPLFRRLPPVDRHIERLTTPDGDFLNVHLHGGSTGKPLVVMLHGLEGSAHSHYIIGLHHAFARLDWSSAVMEFRSCGPEMNRARRLYHSGETSDLDLVVRHFLSRGFEELYLVGFSLGGNVLAKWLGELGPEAPIGVPDIQSPFDIAAIVWNKEDLFPSLIEAPEAVEGLVHKCFRLLTDFLQTFRREIGEVNFCHCPYAWAPPELGCWLSEDEAGSMNVGMFERFCLPTLNALSDTFGGLFMHCCATADHQYGSFGKIRNLRGLNRVFQKPGAKPAIDAFSGRTVLVQAWMDEAALNALLEMAHPDTRFLFNLSVEKPEQAVPLVERLRKRCPRQAANAPREKAVAG